ncbi:MULTISPECIES: Gfo/Idh/MocA family oxidoreductase [unclassified Chelatococcus]|uniref:Gfo/Idh/MocA family protein n=1 Tax=unclassified Chelatococcus TaxID=2638111 RepID=UPI001BD1B1FE|nr:MULTISPECIES: Gfo/Idh/MocA family oxidoreductase [unclassified Chelatococcus]CAH1651961.1 Predicted dehydrogenase [Hyphomicrobiales bacterium]MBS7743097.1 Gfo/Idh/MocA family oxidoreductase [Chelatococcus sp. HY11]MBX3541785.1 Gfo/Idh/MocA family oxidoreductase [Chelatococcus sp.]MCO5074323.1 Gfo/Idh/MocA family oxidoreductase [Chelatococcus sp.]CAH1693576.1 Predicted dehydrogenase [Hyphomicrobiales bacterium]
MEPVKLAIMGAGLIGSRHAQYIAADPGAILSAIIDPAPAGEALANSLGTAWYKNLESCLKTDRPDGVIIATPNQLHVVNGLEAVAAAIPALVEKPIADDVAAATRLVEAAEDAGVPLLVGHHRRFNPMIRKAKDIIDSGQLGQVLTLAGQFWLMKPDDYFDTAWRRAPGGGPVFINLIHDIDLFRYLCGEIAIVQAQESNAFRGHSVEETAVVILLFENGILATISASDAVVAPWSWELTTGENPAYPRQGESCYQIGGSHGALTIPQLELWSNPGERSWREPLRRERIPFLPDDPLKLQIRHFCDVIRGRAAPIVSGREGLNTLKVIEAVKHAARTGMAIKIA